METPVSSGGLTSGARQCMDIKDLDVGDTISVVPVNQAAVATIQRHIKSCAVCKSIGSRRCARYFDLIKEL